MTPVTTPVDAFIDAIAASELLQDPLLVPVEVRPMFAPTQADVSPKMVPAFGSALIVIPNVAVAEPQPVVLDTVYEIVAVPTALPEATPEEGSILAIEGLLDDHVPPLTVEETVVVPPVHRLDEALSDPAIGRAFTVTLAVAAQPVAEV